MSGKIPVCRPCYLDAIEVLGEKYAKDKIEKREAMSDEELLSKYGPVILVFDSTRIKDKKYEVRFGGMNGGYSCACPGWAYRRECKHVVECERRKVTRPPEPEDKLVEAVYDALKDMGYYYRDGDIIGRRGDAKKLAGYIRKRLGSGLLEPQEPQPRPRTTRMIILED